MAKVHAEGLPLASASDFLKKNGLEKEAEGLHVAPGAAPFMLRVKRGKALEILRAKGLLEKFISESWPTGATATGKAKMDWYDRCYQKWLNRGGADEDEEEDPISDAEEIQILEKELQNYLAKNLGLLEPGMTPWKSADGQSHVEFQVDDKGRRIDILAKDKSGNPVVIEPRQAEATKR